jgi:hypothetical protein
LLYRIMNATLPLWTSTMMDMYAQSRGDKLWAHQILRVRKVKQVRHRMVRVLLCVNRVTRVSRCDMMVVQEAVDGMKASCRDYVLETTTRNLDAERVFLHYCCTVIESLLHAHLSSQG